jgi:menaquinol-cytochrome c reductase iron-sulfur subunit
MAVPSGPRIPRRRALVVIGMGVAAVGVSPLVLAGCARSEPVEVTVPLDVASLPVDEPTLVAFDVPRADGSTGKGSAWFLRQLDDSLVVYDPRCTHQGCAYAWEDGDTVFACVCHKAAFDRDGNVLYGPPPRALDRFPATVTGSTIVLTIPLDIQPPKTDA